MNNYDYPLGADNKYAPWNEKEIPEKEVKVWFTQSMSKSCEVLVSDYNIDEEDGTPDFSDTDFEGAYKSEKLTLPELLKRLKDLAALCLKRGYYKDDEEKAKLNLLMAETEGWVEDDCFCCQAD